MRILLVRPQAQAEETAVRLRQRGHVPVIAPILSVVPTGFPPPRGEADAVLVTSRNAVASLALWRERPARIPIFAVGARTGEALAREGFREVAVAGGDGTSLARLVAASLRPGARLLHVAGRDRRPEPARSLGAAGYDVTTWEAYAAEPAATLPEAARTALASGIVDAALHYSPRSAAILLRLVRGAALIEAFGAIRHLCLSPNVAAALETAGPLRIAVAPEPREDALLALLDERAARTE